MTDPVPKIEPYNKKQLAAIYHVSPRTFSRWIAPHLAKIGPPPGRLFLPSQVRIIFLILGPPPD